MSDIPDPDGRFTSPNGLFNLDSTTSKVSDADEEIMELYMNLASICHPTEKGGSGGLGFLDSNKQVLELEVVLKAPVYEVRQERKRGKAGKGEGGKDVRMGVRVVQDLESLKGRKGDTGSVLWRSSLHLAQNILQAYHFASSSRPTLLDPLILSQAGVLELGSGTGLLPVLLSPIVREYTASDLLENLKLVKKNLEVNGIDHVGGHLEGCEGHSQKISKSTTVTSTTKVRIEEIDWVDISQQRRRREQLGKTSTNLDDTGRYDLILAVDCIYNEYLIRPLIDTFETYCPIRGKAVVWVVCELRSSDVMTTFIETWLAEENWEIIRLGEDAMGGWEGSRARWVGWVGWRV